MVDPALSWPPPDPDRIPRKTTKPYQPQNFTDQSTLSDQDYITAFRQRQQDDFKRFSKVAPAITTRRNPFSVQSGDDDNENKPFLQRSALANMSVEEPWRNTDGDKLDDFGVDENAELYDDEDDEEIPLAALLKRQTQSLSNGYLYNRK